MAQLRPKSWETLKHWPGKNSGVSGVFRKIIPQALSKWKELQTKAQFSKGFSNVFFNVTNLLCKLFLRYCCPLSPDITTNLNILKSPMGDNRRYRVT